MVGQYFGQYRVIAKLGAGGMGVVWKAIDTKLEREVALKVLADDERNDSRAASRFLREARCASALNSANIVTIYEASSVGNVHYIAMEYVRGETLQAWLRKGPLPLSRTVEIACQIANALTHAHAAGIVHRDLKPSNVIITPEGQAKVLDFGLAKRTIAAEEGDMTVTQLTAVGTVVGTFPYMSPEQVAGENLDARSDIFSFGVVLYEMLTGTLPFRAETRLGLAKQILHSDPAPPRSLAPGIPEGLASVVIRCLSKSPADRFQNADDVAGQIRAAMEPAVSSTRRLALYWMYAGAALAIVIALLIPGIRHALTSRVWGGGTLTSSATAAASGSSEVDLYRAGRGCLDRYDKPGNVSRAIELMQSSIQKNPNYAPAYAGLSEAYLRRNVASPDPNWIALARDSANKSISLNADLALGHVALGYALLDIGKRAEASTEFERGQDLDPKNAAASIGLAKVAAASGRRAEAEAMFQKGIDLGKSQWLPSMEYGMFLFANERYEEAIQAYERARELTPDNASVLGNEGAAYHMSGSYEEAASLFQQALAIEPNARIYANLGTLRFFQGRFSDAVEPMEKAVQLRATYYLYWGNLGDVYRWAPGLRSKANGAYARAIDLIHKSIAAAPQDAVLRARLAGYLVKSDQREAALGELERFEQIEKKSGMALFKAAIAYEVAGKRDAALRSLEASQRAGYSMQEIETEQELTGLRSDIRYQQSLARLTSPVGSPAIQRNNLKDKRRQ
jgi:eukaryotic-like serine/threonine-protein kinase